MLKHADRVAFLAVPLFILLMLIFGISAPPASMPRPVAVAERPVIVEIIREKKPEPKIVEPPEPLKKQDPEPVKDVKPPVAETPKPAPEPDPVSKPEPAPSPAAEDEDDGVLPPLQADYRKKVGFRRYAEGLRMAGADFFVTGAKPGTLLQIDLASNDLIEVSIAGLANRGYSPRTRDISDEPELAKALKRATDVYNVPNPRVIVLVPTRLEQALAKVLRAGANMKLAEISSVRGEYFLMNGRLHLKITEIYTNRGSSPVDLVFPIG